MTGDRYGDLVPEFKLTASVLGPAPTPASWMALPASFWVLSTVLLILHFFVA